MTIYICGDSTAASYTPEKAPITGWGQVLGEFLPGVKIVNHAFAGRSSKSFLAEGRLQPVDMNIRSGDLLLIQFTHNDRNAKPERYTDPDTTFPAYLSVYVETARRVGAVPVLMTPIPLRQFEDGKLVDTHGAYPDAIRRLAKQKDVALLDVNERAMRELQEMGEAACKPMYMHFEKGLYSAYPDGSADDVHTQLAGARYYARITAELLRAAGLVPPALVVAQDGTGDFLSLQAAVDAAPAGATILVRPGVYRERVIVNKDGLHIVGEDAKKSVVTWSGCAKDIGPDGKEKGTFLSYSFLVTGDDVTVENLTIRNDAGDGREVGQAVAVYAAGDRGTWRNVRMIAHQDTLFCGSTMPKVARDALPHAIPEGVPSVGDCPPVVGRQYFEKCFICGDVDFIFGPYACWFEGCTLHMNERGGWYTAANTPEENPHGFVFRRCRLTGDCVPGAAYLGRPWRRFARTVFLHCDMDACVAPEGFQDWADKPVTNRCGEYGSTGPGAEASLRHPGQAMLTEAEAAMLTIEAVLGGWLPRVETEAQA